ncbi:MAG: ATP-binding cassette domain-containing protein [Deinococcus-Thermus bacterium]|jgi:peptide/nickel transport system ATP-binding protein|nr:ATP-binding cassette domain-containing protein [Deinococcota bacterium]
MTAEAPSPDATHPATPLRQDAPAVDLPGKAPGVATLPDDIARAAAPDRAGETPIVALDGVAKRFVKRLDIAAKLANALGAKQREQVVHAVDRVDLAVLPGEVVGLVGESGCGKSTLGRMVAGIHQPTEGRVRYRGQDVADLKGPAAKDAQLKIQMIFQDPLSSLNPRLRVGEIIGEAPRVHGLVGRGESDDRVAEAMQRVGLDPGYARRYPHQFSGGQRQRIGIARALAVEPDFLVCDEAVAALDVSIQAQVLNLFMRLRDELDLTYLFISHDLGVVEHLSDRVQIMYLGRIVEAAPTTELFAAPNHPYTQALLAEVPRLDTTKRVYTPVKGEIPSPLDPPPGCHFHPRCPHAHERCRVEVPALKEIAPGRLSACHLNDRPG